MGTNRFCAGVDIGGTKISSALFTRDGAMVGRARVPIDERGGDRAASQVAEIIEHLKALASTEDGQLLSIALSVPGVVHPRTGLIWAPNIPGWDHYPLRERLAAGRAGGQPAASRDGVPDGNVPVCLVSDRSAYILGEQWLGAARGATDAVFLAVGTGIGAGILSNGRIVHGAEDIAGAVGWLALSPHFRDDYAVMGCFEAEASGDSVGRRAVRLLGEGQPSLIRDLAGTAPSKVTAELVVEAARKGDAVARRVIAETVSYLAMGIANIVSMLNPEIVVLGGGLLRAADLLLDPVRTQFKRWAQPLAAASVRIELSALGEDAGLYGCGRLAWDAFNGEESCRP